MVLLTIILTSCGQKHPSTTEDVYEEKELGIDYLFKEIPDIVISSGDESIEYVAAKNTWDMVKYDRMTVTDLYERKYGLVATIVPKGSYITIDFDCVKPDTLEISQLLFGIDGSVYIGDHGIEVNVNEIDDNGVYRFVYDREYTFITEDQVELVDVDLMSPFVMTCSWEEGKYEAEYCFMLDNDGSSVEADESQWTEVTGERHPELENVWIETEYEVYPIGTTEINVKWYNDTSDEMMYGDPFYIDKKVGGKWYVVEISPGNDYAFHSIGYSLRANNQEWKEYNLISYTHGLTEGDYRIRSDFFRLILDGKETKHGDDNRNYSIYGYFTVGDTSVQRDMTNLYEDRFEYKNTEYDFMVYLPKAWEGLTVFEEEVDIESDSYELFSKIDLDYKRLILRHPLWTDTTPIQDIVLTIMDGARWNNNVHDATNSDFDLLPDFILSGQPYVIVKDEADYQVSNRGYSDVMDIIGKWFRQYD